MDRHGVVARILPHGTVLIVDKGVARCFPAYDVTIDIVVGDCVTFGITDGCAVRLRRIT